MNKRGGSFWDILAWIVLAGILKVAGVINTPELLEYSPYFGLVYLAGWAVHKLDTATEDIKDITKFNRETINQINIIKQNCLKNNPV